jgi:signal transduction histidine kinase
LSNAIKYTNAGGTVTISAQPSADISSYVFKVSDTGVGITRERMAQVFSTIGETTRGTDGEKGTGLGLMLCAEFVHANGGEIWVDSEPGKGSTFYFSFPI